MREDRLEQNTLSKVARGIKDHLLPPTGGTEGLSGYRWQPNYLIGHKASDSSPLQLSECHPGLQSVSWPPGSFYTDKLTTI